MRGRLESCPMPLLSAAVCAAAAMSRGCDPSNPTPTVNSLDDDDGLATLCNTQRHNYCTEDSHHYYYYYHTPTVY